MNLSRFFFSFKAMSRPSFAIISPEMEIERMSSVPDFPSLQTIAPVFTVISSFCSLTFMTVLGTPAPFFNVNRLPLSLGKTAACPVHLSEPSGQYASGHVCKHGAFFEAMATVSPFAALLLPKELPRSPRRTRQAPYSAILVQSVLS